MNVLLKSANGYTLAPLASKLLADRKIFLEGDITTSSATELLQELMYLTADGQEEPIDIYINSGGGEVGAGLMIYDTIKALKTPLNMYCTGMAASMAAILLAGGQKERRYILPHSKVMIHEPLIMGGVNGSASAVAKTAEMILEVKQITIDLLAADTGRTKEEVEKALSYDHYMTAKEAVEFHICDGIITEPV